MASRDPIISKSSDVQLLDAASVSFESARASGNVGTLRTLWKDLGFADPRCVFRRTRHTTDVEVLFRIMVLDRLCTPESKLGVLLWVQAVALAGAAVAPHPGARQSGFVGEGSLR